MKDIQGVVTLLSGAIELLIDALDRIEGDPDFEKDGTGEPEPLEIGELAPIERMPVARRIRR